jgi:hypothetical protein
MITSQSCHVTWSTATLQQVGEHLGDEQLQTHECQHDRLIHEANHQAPALRCAFRQFWERIAPAGIFKHLVHAGMQIRKDQPPADRPSQEMMIIAGSPS